MNQQQITDSELALMRIIWEKGGSSFLAEIMDALEKEEKNWKTNTVLTFLSRLVDKNMLRTEKSNRKNNYIAIYSESEYSDFQTRVFVDKLFYGDAKNLVSSLVNQSYLSEKDLEEIKKFWNGGEG